MDSYGLMGMLLLASKFGTAEIECYFEMGK